MYLQLRTYKSGKKETRITQWLEVANKKKADSQGLLGVHSFTPIENNEKWWQLEGGFGSASTDALVDFINLVAEESATHIILKGGKSAA